MSEWMAGPRGAFMIGQDKATTCQLCGVVAVVPLAPPDLAKQKDGTTHVCHPGFGGCNHGFEAAS